MYPHKSSECSYLSTRSESLFYIICGSGRYIIVHDSGGEYKLKGKLNDIYERVKGFGFLFIHKSYIVNNLYIRKYSYDNVELDDNVILPVSRQRREEIKKSCSIGL